MFDFSSAAKDREAPRAALSLEEYIAFCAFCMDNNPLLTNQDCLQRRSGEESIRQPFSLAHQ